MSGSSPLGPSQVHKRHRGDDLPGDRACAFNVQSDMMRHRNHEDRVGARRLRVQRRRCDLLLSDTGGVMLERLLGRGALKLEQVLHEKAAFHSVPPQAEPSNGVITGASEGAVRGAQHHRRRVQQVVEPLVVDLKKRRLHNEAVPFCGSASCGHLSEEVPNRTWHDPVLLLRRRLRERAGAAGRIRVRIVIEALHGVCLARARLAIGEHCSVEAIHHLPHERSHLNLIPEISLGALGAEHRVEGEASGPRRF
mmetsp:Transcript_62775/g.180596  ORF Transcript_62775/g.180596 Transcript_62775/m.180596 type:complete len:252 (+) Transcript_62775:465-1220(+)